MNDSRKNIFGLAIVALTCVVGCCVADCYYVGGQKVCFAEEPTYLPVSAESVAIPVETASVPAVSTAVEVAASPTVVATPVYATSAPSTVYRTAIVRQTLPTATYVSHPVRVVRGFVSTPTYVEHTPTFVRARLFPRAVARLACRRCARWGP